MNENLQILFDQAFEYGRTNGCSNRAVVEKFAELIVKECAEIADDGYGSDHFGNGIAGYQLLKHFGVE